MTTEDYSALTGNTSCLNQKSKTDAMITRARIMLERMLGYSLEVDKRLENQYTETGKLKSQLYFCCDDIANAELDPPDTIVSAYRLFSYNPNDAYFIIDPCTTVNKVKLVRGNITVRTINPNNYRLEQKDGYISSIQRCERFCLCRPLDCRCVQLAVDAEWLWENGEIPTDLKLAWSDLVTYYMNPKKGIRSETLGSHSYSRFDDDDPEKDPFFQSIVKKYAGGNGTVGRINIY